jgi:paraquat-inducible protein B
MSKANPALIGGFVVGAIALIVIGLLVFGGTSWFAQRSTYIAYFPGSVKGLQVGAPVDFRGVNIGEVTDIKVVFDPKDVTARIPVVMQFDPSRITVVGMEPTGSYQDRVKGLIEAGFRAQLQSQSLLTGLLFVNLDFHKNAPSRLVGGDQPYPEIPTIPSGMEQLQQSAGDIAAELPNVLNNLNDVLTSINNELQASGGNVQQIVADMADIANRIQERGPVFDKILDNVDGATGDVRQTARALEQIIQTNQDAIGALIDEWTVTASSVRRMADQINATIAENREGLRDFTENGLYEYTGLAQDAQRMVDQFTRVGERIERDPAGFLFGDRVRQGVQPQ